MYNEHLPATILLPYIECYWEIKSAQQKYHITPDGCTDIIFNLSIKGNEDIKLIGTSSRMHKLSFSDTHHLFGIRFNPAGIKRFTSLSMDEITDGRVSLTDIKELSALKICHEGLRQSNITANNREQINLFFMKLLSKTPAKKTDHNILRMLNHLKNTKKTNVRVSELTQMMGASRQHLNRVFLKHIGISPKQFLDIMRIRRLINEIKNSDSIDWISLALQHGFVDQSHLIHQFKHYIQTTPQTYLDVTHR